MLSRNSDSPRSHPRQRAEQRQMHSGSFGGNDLCAADADFRSTLSVLQENRRSSSSFHQISVNKCIRTCHKISNAEQRKFSRTKLNLFSPLRSHFPARTLHFFDADGARMQNGARVITEICTYSVIFRFKVNRIQSGTYLLSYRQEQQRNAYSCCIFEPFQLSKQ